MFSANTGSSPNVPQQINTPPAQSAAAQLVQSAAGINYTQPGAIATVAVSDPNPISSLLLSQQASPVAATTMAVSGPNPNLLLSQPTSTFSTSTTSTFDNITTISVPHPINDPHISSSVPGQEVTICSSDFHDNQDSDDNLAPQENLNKKSNQLQTTPANASKRRFKFYEVF